MWPVKKCRCMKIQMSRRLHDLSSVTFQYIQTYIINTSAKSRMQEHETRICVFLIKHMYICYFVIMDLKKVKSHLYE